MNQTSTRPSYRTPFNKRQSLRWLLVDATDQPVGRLAAKVSHLLQGKDSPDYTPHWDGGERVVIVNADKVRFTGSKAAQKIYYSYSGWIGGLKERKASDLLETNPTEVLKLAIKGMLPHTNLGRQMLKNVKIFAGETHDHEAQQPKKVEV